MYTILVNDDNSLTTSVRERIVQRSKLVDTLHFLVPPTYKNCDMSKFTVNLEYILPVSRELHTDILTRSPELYKGYLEYKVPLDTSLTKEAGKVELKLTFICVEMDANGMTTQKVRKTTATTMTVVACSAWCDIVPDQALSAFDQRLIMMEAMIHAIDDENQILFDTKADNIKYNNEDSTIQLVANGVPIGDKVVISTSGGASVNAIQKILLSDDGNLVAIYADGTEEFVGKIDSNCPGVYVPSLVAPDKLTFTLQEDATEKEIVIDIDRTNEWNTEEGTTSYIWDKLD